jgi:Calcineurin-like phosphoesterase
MNYTFIGDAHGKIKNLLQLLTRLRSIKDHNKQPGRIIQLGDMGLGFPNVILPPQDDAFAFIRGNHDSPSLCRQHPNYARDWGMFNGIFFVAGAYSIDAAWRIQWEAAHRGQHLWWPDEQLPDESLEAAYQQYLVSKPSIVATHEAPAAVGRQILQGFRAEKLDCVTSRTAVALQRMFAQHQPNNWFFGHYHRSWTQDIEGTTFTCLNELEYVTLQGGADADSHVQVRQADTVEL